MNYRPDIDGLRAIAILLVLVYHGGLSLFPSGFVGVDVFFVISGFLITGIIHESLANDRFSFIDFYNRRLWRLQPVFVSLLLVTTVAALCFLLPDDLIEFSRSARKTSLFISNFFFSRTTTGYFSPDSHQLPLLHTWSLSVEWQCYFILPLVMYGLHRLLRPQYIARVVLVLTIAFFLISMSQANETPAQSYYLFSSRIFEFLMGSCVALASFKTTMPLASFKYLLNLLAGLAFVVILYTASLNHILIGYPNGYAFLVCLATAILIALGRFYPQLTAIKLLACKPLVFIGVLSYSLYIWHWAIFALLRYEGIRETSMVLLVTYAIIFSVAYLSWRWIERPSRALKRIKFHYTVGLLVLVPALGTHGVSYLIQNHFGFPQRFNEELVMVYQQLSQYNSAQRPLCISNAKTEINQCTLGSKKPNSKSALMIGDSFSNHYWGFMDTLGQAANIKVLAQGTSSCIALPGVDLYNWWHFKNSIYQDCHDQTVRYYRMIQDNHYDYVILGQIWGNYVSESVINHPGDLQSLVLAKKRLERSLDDALKIITESGARPVLIKTTALMQDNFHECFFKHIKNRQPYDSSQCSFDLKLSENEAWFDRLFDTMQARYPQLILIDPKQVQCPKGICSADVNGIPVYREGGHITDYASYQFGTLYLQQLGNPLTPA